MMKPIFWTDIQRCKQTLSQKRSESEKLKRKERGRGAAEREGLLFGR